MENNLVGYRFSPTGEEVINYYLKNKIHGNSWLVDDAISEVNIYNYEPWFLPSLSKLESKDLEWYFFSRNEYTSTKKKVTYKRATPCGFWKATGVDRKIKDRRGNGVEIGIKKTLVYHEGNAANQVRTPWVMHEYSLPLVNQSAYVICQVMYKGEDGDKLYVNNNYTEPEVSPVSENYNPYVQQETLLSDEELTLMLNYNGGNFDIFRSMEVIMQNNHNDHTPNKPLTGIIVDSSTDSNAKSIYTTSDGDSDGTLNKHFNTGGEEILSLRKDSCKDIITRAETFTNRKTRKSHFTRRTMPSKQELKEGKSKAIGESMDRKKSSPMVKTEKKGGFITKEAMGRRTRKNPPYIYLVNMIISFIILVAVIGNII